MWTQVTQGQLRDKVFVKLGRELGIEFEEPSYAMFLTYRTGKWLYDEHGSRLGTRLRRWGTGAERIVNGPTSGESEKTYLERLERELCAVVSELMAGQITG